MRRNYESENSASVYCLPLNKKVDYGGKGYGSLVKGRTFCIFTATDMESVGGVKQCKVELIQYFDLGGKVILPTTLTEKLVAGAMGFIGKCQETFQVRGPTFAIKISNSNAGSTPSTARRGYRQSRVRFLHQHCQECVPILHRSRGGNDTKRKRFSQLEYEEHVQERAG